MALIQKLGYSGVNVEADSDPAMQRQPGESPGSQLSGLDVYREFELDSVDFIIFIVINLQFKITTKYFYIAD